MCNWNSEEMVEDWTLFWKNRGITFEFLVQNNITENAIGYHLFSNPIMITCFKFIPKKTNNINVHNCKTIPSPEKIPTKLRNDMHFSELIRKSHIFKNSKWENDFFILINLILQLYRVSHIRCICLVTFFGKGTIFELFHP